MTASNPFRVEQPKPKPTPKPRATPKPKPKARKPSKPAIPAHVRASISWMCDRIEAMYAGKSGPALRDVQDVRRWLDKIS